MNCGTCRECKIKIWVFEKKKFFWIFPICFFVFFWQCFGFFGVFVKGIVFFNIGFGFCVLNSIYRHGLKIFFDPKKSKKSTPKIDKKPSRVNNFRTKHLGGYFWGGSHATRSNMVALYIHIYIYILKKKIYIKKIYIQDDHVGPVACELVLLTNKKMAPMFRWCIDDVLMMWAVS